MLDTATLIQIAELLKLHFKPDVNQIVNSADKYCKVVYERGSTGTVDQWIMKANSDSNGHAARK